MANALPIMASFVIGPHSRLSALSPLLSPVIPKGEYYMMGGIAVPADKPAAGAN